MISRPYLATFSLIKTIEIAIDRFITENGRGSLREAMAGVKRASFVHSCTDLFLQATTNFALIARRGKASK